MKFPGTYVSKHEKMQTQEIFETKISKLLAPGSDLGYINLSTLLMQEETCDKSQVPRNDSKLKYYLHMQVSSIEVSKAFPLDV